MALTDRASMCRRRCSGRGRRHGRPPGMMYPYPMGPRCRPEMVSHSHHRPHRGPPSHSYGSRSHRGPSSHSYGSRSDRGPPSHSYVSDYY